MAGQIKKMIDEIIQKRSRGNPAIIEMTIAKLILKGINPKNFDDNSPDDLGTIEKLINIAKQLNIKGFENKEINIKYAYSTKLREEEAVLELREQLSVNDIKLVVFFASPTFDEDKISRLMKEEFSNSAVVGCSSAGELISGKALKNSVVAMSINSNILADIKVEVIENINGNLNLETAFRSFEEYFDESLYHMDSRKFVGITLIDGMSKREEKIMDLIGNRTNIFFAGGSAADNNRYVKTFVYANGKAYTNAAVLVLLKINDNSEFRIIKTQSFKEIEKTLIANKVNEENREVIEFNHKPAIFAYAEALEVPSIECAEENFMKNPLGVEVGKENIFVRGAHKLNGTNMLFCCNILENMEVKLLEATNIVEDTQNAIEEKINKLGKVDGIINFHCVHRTLQLEKENLLDQYAELFRDIPTIGFSAYGEQFIGHLNQTSIMLVFKSNI